MLSQGVICTAHGAWGMKNQAWGEGATSSAGRGHALVSLPCVPPYSLIKARTRLPGLGRAIRGLGDLTEREKL